MPRVVQFVAGYRPGIKRWRVTVEGRTADMTPPEFAALVAGLRGAIDRIQPDPAVDSVVMDMDVGK
jgi:hypothetical protein